MSGAYASKEQSLYPYHGRAITQIHHTIECVISKFTLYLPYYTLFYSIKTRAESYTRKSYEIRTDEMHIYI